MSRTHLGHGHCSPLNPREESPSDGPRGPPSSSGGGPQATERANVLLGLPRPLDPLPPTPLTVPSPRDSETRGVFSISPNCIRIKPRSKHFRPQRVVGQLLVNVEKSSAPAYERCSSKRVLPFSLQLPSKGHAAHCITLATQTKGLLLIGWLPGKSDRGR